VWSELGLRVGRHVSVSRLHRLPGRVCWALCSHTVRSLASPREACCPRLGHIGAVGNGTCRSRNSVRDRETTSDARSRTRCAGRVGVAAARTLATVLGGGRTRSYHRAFKLEAKGILLSLCCIRSHRITHTKIKIVAQGGRASRSRSRGGCAAHGRLDEQERTLALQQRTRPTRYYRLTGAIPAAPGPTCRRRSCRRTRGARRGAPA